MKELYLSQIVLEDLTFPPEIKPLEAVCSQIESAIISSFPERISLKQQREINEVMTVIEGHQNGKVTLTDNQWAALLGWWGKRSLPAFRGDLRKLHSRIDKLLCPEAKEELS